MVSLAGEARSRLGRAVPAGVSAIKWDVQGGGARGRAVDPVRVTQRVIERVPVTYQATLAQWDGTLREPGAQPMPAGPGDVRWRFARR